MDNSMTTTPKDSRTMRDCPYPTEVFTEGQLESFCGCAIDDLDPTQSYNLSGVHLWQILDGYRHLLNTRSDKAPTPENDSREAFEEWLRIDDDDRNKVLNDRSYGIFEAGYQAATDRLIASSIPRIEGTPKSEEWIKRSDLLAMLDDVGMSEVVAKELYNNAANGNPRVIPFEQSCEERLRWMWQAKAALSAIKEKLGV